MKTILLILAFGLLFIQNLHSQIELTAMKQLPEEIYSACSDAVVLVNNYDRDNTLLGYGSGVIVSASGVVYTNYHVIERGFRIEIRNGNDIYDSIPIVGFDPFNDAAILKLPEGNYPFIRLSNDESTKPGSSIYALGNPIGYSKTFTPGIVSAICTESIL